MAQKRPMQKKANLMNSEMAFETSGIDERLAAFGTATSAVDAIAAHLHTLRNGFENSDGAVFIAGFGGCHRTDGKRLVFVLFVDQLDDFVAAVFRLRQNGPSHLRQIVTRRRYFCQLIPIYSPILVGKMFHLTSRSVLRFILDDILLAVVAFVHRRHLAVLQHQRLTPILAHDHLHVLQLVETV